MTRAKKLLTAILATVCLTGAALTGASAETMTQEGCIEYQNNVCTQYQSCQLDTVTGNATCFYYFLIRGKFKLVYSEQFPTN
jgi:hypothetical protein